jgi:hypothetical protein
MASQKKIERNVSHFFYAYAVYGTSAQAVWNAAMHDLGNKIYFPQIRELLPEYQDKGLWLTVKWEVEIN